MSEKFKLNITPFPHQQLYIMFALKCDYTLLGDEMGLGKTLSAISVSVAMDCKTLVVCPSFLRYNWKAEYLKFTNISEDQILVIDKPKDFKETSNYKIVIMSYARLGLAQEVIKNSKYIIADEAHYLKNMESKRADLFHCFVRRYQPDRLTLLTGTPIKNKVGEFYSLLKLLSYTPTHSNGKSIDDKFRSKHKFEAYFSYDKSYSFEGPRGTVYVQRFEGLRNPEELKTFLKGKYLRRLTKDVINLPQLLTRYVEVNYSFDDSKIMEEYEKYKGKLEGHIMKLKKGSAMAKAKFTASYAENVFVETGNPLVIFSDHVDPVLMMQANLKNSRMILGRTSMDERQEIVNLFQARKINYLIATIGSASVGITLTAASDLIFNDMSYVPADNAQASKRIHRIGQEKTCRIHKICGSLVDKQIMTSLSSKQIVIDSIV